MRNAKSAGVSPFTWAVISKKTRTYNIAYLSVDNVCINAVFDNMNCKDNDAGMLEIEYMHEQNTSLSSINVGGSI